MGQRFRDVDSTLLYDGRRRRAAFWMRYWLCPASNLAPAPGFAADASSTAFTVPEGLSCCWSFHLGPGAPRVPRLVGASRAKSNSAARAH